jgi:cytochrome c-type biogenesis protein CcmE
MSYRALVLPVVGAIVVLGGFLVSNLNDNLVYYLTPAEAVADQADYDDGERFRLGGLVEQGSVERTDDGVRFVLVDGRTRIRVVHTGAPAQLFQSGIGVIAEGSWRDDTFYSDTMIVKHDENYARPATDETTTDGRRP